MKILRGVILLIFVSSCKDSGQKFDASGTFEATEIIVSAESTGKILALDIKEGDSVSKGRIIGAIDPLSIELQKEQIEASMTALTQKSNDASPQISVFQEQIAVQRNQVAVQKQQLLVLEKEQKRLDNLVKADAATPKQLDDINGQIAVLKKQIDAAESSIKVFERQISAQTAVVGIQNRGILSEKLPLEKRMKQLDDQLSRTKITNPIDGIVLSKYAEAGEVTTMGKAIYKIADMSDMILRAYITGDQLGQVKINQKVKVMIDEGKDKYRELQGTLFWIADKAEFTPKTVQTKDERANLVYAVKIKVKNDATLKIGMYGEVLFN
ncbi:MAG: HlyD family efflux transporter periplasmic adaptor subunit [Saprospiraceae bacterium]|nr:HlyD family efflux transporter periplasmic adaptor subunit [Saprospiraceae bacterium]